MISQINLTLLWWISISVITHTPANQCNDYSESLGWNFIKTAQIRIRNQSKMFIGTLDLHRNCRSDLRKVWNLRECPFPSYLSTSFIRVKTRFFFQKWNDSEMVSVHLHHHNLVWSNLFLHRNFFLQAHNKMRKTFIAHFRTWNVCRSAVQRWHK